MYAQVKECHDVKLSEWRVVRVGSCKVASCKVTNFMGIRNESKVPIDDAVFEDLNMTKNCTRGLLCSANLSVINGNNYKKLR
jgi:hypothetical protein